MSAVRERSTTEFLTHFLRAYPGRTASMVGLLILAGLSEGVGLLSLLPLLQHMAGGAGEPGGPAGAVGTLLGAVGLEPSPGPLLLLIVVAITLKGLLLWLAMREVGYTVARVAHELRLRLIRALTRADWRYFTGQPAGHFTTALGDEAQRASRAYMDACEGLAGLIQTAIYLAVVWALSWRAALLAIVLGGVVGFALRGLIGMTREAGWRQTRIMRSMIARSGEVLTGVKSIKAMGREDDVWPMIEHETQAFQVAQERLVLARETLRASQEPIAVAIVGAGLYLTLGYAGIAFSSLLVLAVVFYRLLTKASELQGQYQSMVTNESAFWTLHDHIERAEAAREHDRGSTPPPVPFRAIRFDGVALGHGGADVLTGLSLTLPAGRLIAFEGASGAGKSTLVDAIVGLAAPTAGRILVDGVPLSEIDAARWRRSIGYVPQEVLLFHDTVRANVTLGNRRFDDAAVRAALGSAGALEFVEALPDGLDHVVGERGTRLSGGQRQRIAIARALIGVPVLLVLDEATAALDPETEAAICRTLVSLRPAVTVLAISHQPAVREVADLAFEVAGGSVVPVARVAAVAATGTRTGV